MTTNTIDLIKGNMFPMLFVKDVEASVEFYHDKLGFEFNGWWDENTNDNPSENNCCQH